MVEVRGEGDGRGGVRKEKGVKVGGGTKGNAW